MTKPKDLVGIEVDGHRLEGYLGRGLLGWRYAAAGVHAGVCAAIGSNSGGVAPTAGDPRPVRVEVIPSPADRWVPVDIDQLRILQKLKHEYLVAGHRIGSLDRDGSSGCLYVVYRDATVTLAGLVEHGTGLSRDDFREMFVHVASALDHLHRRGASHGELSAKAIWKVGTTWKLALGSRALRSLEKAATSRGETSCRGRDNDVVSLAETVIGAAYDLSFDRRPDRDERPATSLEALRFLQADDDPIWRNELKLIEGCVNDCGDHPPSAAELVLAGEELPDVPHEFEVTGDNGRRVIAWEPPENGAEVRIYIPNEGGVLQPGQRLPSDGLDQYGTPLEAEHANSASLSLERHSGCHVQPVAVRGPIAVPGEPIWISTIEDVRDLSVWVDDQRLEARWLWPSGVDEVRVMYRRDRFPCGPFDPEASYKDWSRDRDDFKGGFSLPLLDTEQLYLAVFASIKIDDQHRVYASGQSPGARQRIPVSRCATVRYSIESRSAWGFGKPRQYVLKLTVDRPTVIPPLQLFVRMGHVPLRLGDGWLQWQQECDQRCSPDNPIVEPLSIDDLASGPWFARLFVLTDDEAAWINCIPEQDGICQLL